MSRLPCSHGRRSSEESFRFMHSDSCMQRMEELLKRTPEGQERLDAAVHRMTRAIAEEGQRIIGCITSKHAESFQPADSSMGGTNPAAASSSRSEAELTAQRLAEEVRDEGAEERMNRANRKRRGAEAQSPSAGKWAQVDGEEGSAEMPGGEIGSGSNAMTPPNILWKFRHG